MNRFIILSNETLDGLSPIDCLHPYIGRVVDEDGEVVEEGRRSTLRDVTYPHMTTDLCDGTSIILLSEKRNKVYGRNIGTNEDDDLQWDAWLEATGYDLADIFGDKERAELLPEEGVD